MLTLAHTGVSLGFFIGAIPTISMTLSSMLLSSIKVSSHIEAGIQNFAAGLIIAAVAAELFPLMLEASQTESMIGITVGFVVGLSTLNGLEAIIEKIEEIGDSSSQSSSIHSVKNELHKDQILTYPDGLLFDQFDVEAAVTNTSSLIDLINQPHDSPKTSKIGKFVHNMSPEDWEAEPLAIASKAFESIDHRNHLLEHMTEVANAIKAMEEKSNRLLEETNLTTKATEEIAEKIDEEIHSLQYKLDHCRRLIQGSESDVTGNAVVSWVTEERKLAIKQRLRNLKLIVDHIIEHIHESKMMIQGSESDVTGNAVVSWVTEERKLAIKQRLRNLKLIVDHIIEHIHESKIDAHLLSELYSHMDDMERQITLFHATVATVSQRWTRRSRPMPEPVTGDFIPVGLVIPVTLDCFVDGFLIGVSCALSPEAGIILGAANCLEMSFLGMAYSTRLSRCTGSSLMMRLLALYMPPLLMFLSSGFGAFLGILAHHVPSVFIAFVAFGVVALLALVCNELLIEARDAQGDDERWYITIMVFAGVYIVLMLSAAGF
eukprot:CAMPEP_0196767874 /NCGR_PEP_ID=MMETSP1095-20130614/42065_1 /TAXON_ID=96789 ORGANISM="Chromulina nebulosa, Strain UTEXLB2642" /NCGR_SAMPLE_ID=MMETSP1095 /ASSEMBLY_ACC=CAM_ASM_000446 /LENGTH=545 /DNA_ID=CAMNT_0042136649 /DNA_START=42 /DNA_END=1683 /DNA_ORIENTATION=-